MNVGILKTPEEGSGKRRKSVAQLTVVDRILSRLSCRCCCPWCLGRTALANIAPSHYFTSLLSVGLFHLGSVPVPSRSISPTPTTRDPSQKASHNQNTRVQVGAQFTSHIHLGYKWTQVAPHRQQDGTNSRKGPSTQTSNLAPRNLALLHSHGPASQDERFHVQVRTSSMYYGALAPAPG